MKAQLNHYWNAPHSQAVLRIWAQVHNNKNTWLKLMNTTQNGLQGSHYRSCKTWSPHSPKMNQSSNNHARGSATAAHLTIENQLGPNFNLWKTLYLQPKWSVKERSCNIIKIKPYNRSNSKLFYIEAGRLGMHLLESQSPALSVTFHP